MTRQSRTPSQTGIYHVMLTGVNRQQIFEEKDDFQRFIAFLHDLTMPTDKRGRRLPPRCIFFAYCLMPNHVHLLVKEASDTLAVTMKQLALRYAMYYNNKYKHFGHLFQDRFKSEPVNDQEYFITLLRYIHQKPVAGKICDHVEDYDWSSWREYIKAVNRMSTVCSIFLVLKQISIKDLRKLVNTPLSKAQQVLEFDRYRGFVPDEKVIEFLKSTYHLKHPKDIHLLPKEERDEILVAAKTFGASMRQLSRLTSFSTYIISHARKKKRNNYFAEESTM